MRYLNDLFSFIKLLLLLAAIYLIAGDAANLLI